MTDYPNNIPAKLEIIKASEITPKEVRWLWYPYIPFGKVTLLQGDPGDGKSKLMLYHLHIVAIPTVRKEILWSKRCKDEALRCTVKEVINQVSHSKKWKNTVPLLDENGQQLISKYGKPMFRKSYSVLQDKLFEHMTEAGFTGFERGVLGSTAENLSSLDYQIQKDKERLAHIQERIEAEQVRYEPAHEVHKTMAEIEGMGQKTITGKIAVSKDDYQHLTALAKEGITSRSEIQDLRSSVSYYQRQYFNASSAVERLQERYDRLKEKSHKCAWSILIKYP